MAKIAQLATVYQHPRSPVTFDPPVTPASIRAAVEASNAERAEVNRLTNLNYPMHPLPEIRDERLRQVEIIDALGFLIEKYDYATVTDLVRRAWDGLPPSDPAYGPALEAMGLLIEQFGHDRVTRWLRFAGHLRGVA